MQNNITTLLFSILAGIAFVFFTHFKLLQKVPGFYCEGFGCIGIGIFYLAIGYVLIPVMFGIFGYVFSKEDRLKQAFSSLVISLIVMGLSFLVIKIWNDFDVRKATEEGDRATQELYLKMGIPLSQLSQELPLLDSRRPVTIANQLTHSTMVSSASFMVEAYARLDAVLADGALQAKIWVFVPGTTQRKDIADGRLFPTQELSADGRSVFKGTLSFTETFGATGGYLSVTGKDGVADSIEVFFR